MNEIEWLAEQLKVRLPEVVSKVDKPHRPTGNHWLDVTKGEKCVTVEWRPGQGFGFFAEDAGYGEGPAEVITTKEEALEKIISSFQKQ
jgi:hypothetical protein